MQQTMMIYDRDHKALDREDPEYTTKCRAWWAGQEKAERVVWEALCEVLYAAHYKMMESSGGYAIDYDAVNRLDAAIDTVLEAMPAHAKARFDLLMLRPCVS